MSLSKIKKDLKKLENAKKRGWGKQDKNMQIDIDEAITYLNELKYLVSNRQGKFKMYWEVADSRIISRPFKTKDFKFAGVNHIDYISFNKDTKVLRIDVTNLLNLQYLSLAYKDLGYEKEDIECIFEELGTFSGYNADVLNKELDIFNLYYIAKDLIVDRGSCLDRDSGCVYDYYQHKVSKGGRYRQVFDSTMSNTQGILISYLFSRFRKMAEIKHYRLVSVSENFVCFIVQGDFSTSDIFNSGLYVRFLGRLIDVTPHMDILSIEDI